MKDYELLEKQASMMRMAENYGVDDWRKLVRIRFEDNTWRELKQCYMYVGDNHYKFAIGVVEGRAVFEGDTLYFKTNGHACEMTVYGMPIDGFDTVSWNPPALDTVMVELSVDVANIVADYPSTHGWVSAELGNACRKALEANRE